MSERIIAIGDVHGCHEELAQLVEKLSLRSSDTVVMLGDVVNRGPDSHKTLQLCRGIGALSLLGNHERRLLQARCGSSNRQLSAVDRTTYAQLDSDDWAYLAAMCKYYHDPASDTVLVHGGFLPGRPWRDQGKSIVTQIQVIDSKGRPRKRSDAPPGCPHWSDFWNCAPYVVYGHTPWHQVRRTEWTLGLDTGCVYGGFLSAFVLPERAVVQVRAKQTYFRPPAMWRNESGQI